MTGRYMVPFPDLKWFSSNPREQQHVKNWSRFVAVCRSLNRDGLSYEVQFNITGDNPHVLVTASGTAKLHRPSVARRLTLPPPIPAQRCRERAVEVEWFLPESASRRNAATTYW